MLALCVAMGLLLGLAVYAVGRQMLAPPPQPVVQTVFDDGARMPVANGRSSGLTDPQGNLLPVRTVLNVSKRMHFGDFFWNESGAAAGPVWVRVDLSRQLISVFRQGDEIGTAVILYGAENKPTPFGNFTVQQKAVDYHSRTYDAPMPFMLRLTGDGVAIHASQVQWGKATHGCIGVPREFARRLFARMQLGDAVMIIAPEKTQLTRR